MDNPLNLTNKVALISGAARGIGAACAETLAAAGASVLVTDVLEKEGAEVVARIEKTGGTAAFMRLDVTDEGQWESTVAAAVERLGGLDVLVNNAGMEIFKPIADTSLEEWRRLQAVNVEGVFLGVKHAIRAMMPGGAAGRGGSIVNISSVAGYVGFAGLGAYSASKGAVALLTKTAALECAQAKLGIRVNSVHPGIIETDMVTGLASRVVGTEYGATLEEVLETFKSLHPLGTMGQPADVARVVLFLASDASAWVTGSGYLVDGGLTAQ